MAFYMKEIYLDNAATTAIYTDAAEIRAKVARGFYGNPSSLHRAGMAAEKYIKEARQSIAGALGCAADEIYFTSGGTEADNLAILGFCNANHRRGKHIITTKIEHPAVYDTVRHLGEGGFEVDYLDADSAGRISIEQLKQTLRSDTILVSIMHVNNEVGSILPIDRIKSVIKQISPVAALHVDAVQSFGKIDVLPSRWGIDLLSVSAHKIHGAKGVGALYVRKGTIIKPILFGGGQQKGLRPGTENVPGIAAFGTAAEISAKRRDANYAYVARLKQRLYDGAAAIPNVVINGGIGESHVPYILNMSFVGVRSEILLHSLESKGIYVSSGSACSSNKPQPSKTLTTMGKSKAEIDSAIRFSFSEYNTQEEIAFCIEALTQEVAGIRKYT